MEQSTAKGRTPSQPVPAARADIARAIHGLSRADQLRLEAIARLRARALPEGIGWGDLLHEAIRRALDGARAWPEGLPLVAFLAGIMRSIWSEQLRRPLAMVALDDDFADPAPDPERVLAAAETVGTIYRLFAGDIAVLRIIGGLADGQTAAEIRHQAGLSATDYDSARRRMRRALLRTLLPAEGEGA